MADISGLENIEDANPYTTPEPPISPSPSAYSCVTPELSPMTPPCLTPEPLEKTTKDEMTDVSHLSTWKFHVRRMRETSKMEAWMYETRGIALGTIRSLERVRLGQLSSLRYRSRINTCLAANHVVSDVTLYQKEEVASTFVTHADIEAVDFKYMLCGLSDGGVAIYDVSKIQGQVYSEVGSVKGGHQGGHKRSVEYVQWYPADNGLFATSSRDRSVKIWDSNRLSLVEQFKFSCHIWHHHMSPVATKHSLLSASGDTGEIILCDVRTGSSTHRIVAHEERVMLTRWSPRNQHVLASGGKDRIVKIWDVRSAKACLMSLDMDSDSHTDTKRSEKSRKRTPRAHRNRVTSLCFTSDGLWLLTFSYDEDLKLWNSSTGENMNIDYGETYTDLKVSLQMAVSSCTYPDLVFAPCKSNIIVYDVFSGAFLNALRGHSDRVLGVLYNSKSMNLYSYGADRKFITWTPSKLLTDNLSDEEEDGIPVFRSRFKRPSYRVQQYTWGADEG